MVGLLDTPLGVRISIASFVMAGLLDEEPGPIATDARGVGRDSEVLSGLPKVDALGPGAFDAGAGGPLLLAGKPAEDGTNYNACLHHA